MMVQTQIPLSYKISNQSWKVTLAEKLTGRPLGDFGDPEDIAETAAFLASSRYIKTLQLNLYILFSFKGQVHDRILY